VWLIHTLADLLHKRKHNQRGDGVADEGGDDEYQCRKDD